MAEPWVAIFCPNCGVHLNDFDEHDTEDRQPDLGSAYTCFWCKVRTRDWNHVKQCRRTWKERERLAERARVTERREINGRLQEMIAELEDVQLDLDSAPPQRPHETVAVKEGLL